MKSVLISIQPKWCEFIAHGKKTVEVRKSAPRLETPFKCYIYCTKPRKFIHGYPDGELFRHIDGRIECGFSFQITTERGVFTKDNFLSGKVIGEFVCDCIDNLRPDYEPVRQQFFYNNDWENNDWNSENHCLTSEELLAYGKGKMLYGWHITELKIYDKPKPLSAFARPLDRANCGAKGCGFLDGKCCKWINAVCLKRVIKTPPQNWGYAEEI